MTYIDPYTAFGWREKLFSLFSSAMLAVIFYVLILLLFLYLIRGNSALCTDDHSIKNLKALYKH